MLKGVVYILILTQFVGYVEEMKIVCPQNNQLEMRAYDFCKKNASKYHCLPGQDGNLIEICVDPVQVPAGKYPVYSRFGNKFIFEDCHEEYYQPVPLMSNKFYIQRCSRMKSLCNNEGEIICHNGSTTTNRMCLCNYTAGFIARDYTVNEQNRTCFDKISGFGGCYMYIKHCPDNQELNPAYKCVNKCPKGYHRPFKQYQCSRISIEITTSTVFISHSTTSVFPTKQKVDDDNNNKALLAIVIGVAVILILPLCIAASIFSLWRFKKDNKPDSNLPDSSRMTELRSLNNGSGPAEEESSRMAELRSSNNGSRSVEEGGIHIKELKITANEVHFGDGVTVGKISEQNSGDTIFLENELTTGIEGELPPGSKRQVPTGSEVQVLTGCTGEVSTGSKTQVSTDSMGHLKTGSEIQMPTDNIEQMSTVNKTQVSTDTTVQVSTGNEIQESEGCESQMDLSDEISTDDCDDEEKPLLNSKVGEDEEKPLLNSKDGEDEEKPLLNSKVGEDEEKPLLNSKDGEDEEKPLLNSKVGEDEEKPLLNSKVGEDEEKSLLNSKVGEDEEKPLLNSKVGEDEEKPLLNSKADNLGKLQMIDFLSRKKYGISTVYLQDVSEDGHCLEYAFIMLLKQNYPNEYEEMDVEKLRRYLVKFLKSNPNTPGGQQYKEFLSLPSDPDRGLIHPEDIAIEENVENISDQMELRWQRFLKRIQDGDWGGSVELQGLSQMFDVPINVLRLNENQDDLLQYNFNSGLDNYQNPPIWLGRISLEGKGFHFVALLPVELLTTRASDGSE